MTLAPVSCDVVSELARTRSTPAGIEALGAALHARRLLYLKALLLLVEQRRATLPPAVLLRFEQDWALLERAEHADAGAVRDVVDYPMTGSWLAQVLAAPEGDAFQRQLAHLGGVAVTAAVRAGSTVGGTLAVPSGVLVLPGLGLLRCPSGEVRLSSRAGLVRISDGAGRRGVVLVRRTARTGPGGRPVGGGPGWSRLRALPGSRVVFDDLDPYRTPSHGVGPAALPAAGRPHSAYRLWAERWREARILLSVTDPGRAAEVGAVLRAVVPLAPSRHRGGTPVSATLRDAPGAVLAQLPGDAGQLTESLVHEIHHTKLAALHELVPLCRRGEGGLHRVGWRPDPRPALGVLQGAYAHLALIDLWWRAKKAPAAPAAWRARAVEQFETYREQVGEALSVLLESDELTSTGREFVRGMGRYHASLGTADRDIS